MQLLRVSSSQDVWHLALTWYINTFTKNSCYESNQYYIYEGDAGTDMKKRKIPTLSDRQVMKAECLTVWLQAEIILVALEQEKNLSRATKYIFIGLTGAP